MMNVLYTGVLVATLVATPAAAPAYEQATMIHAQRAQCPEGILTVEYWDTDGIPDNGGEKVTVKDSEGKLRVILTYEVGLEGKLIGGSVLEEGDMVYYGKDAFLAKYDDVCTVLK